MDKLIVQGGAPLQGEVSASGAKNSALKLLFSSLLAEGEHVFYNVPQLKDVESACVLLESLGCKIQKSKERLSVIVSSPFKSGSSSLTAHYDIVRKMRASILCLGPLLTKYGEAHVSLPGGCAIGTRPIDQHLEGLRAMGATIQVEDGYVIAKAQKLIGANYLFETTTVGGTENLMMAAVLAEGITVLENAAKEPEIVDLANYLNLMGAKISGQGTSIITITGVDRLRPAEYTVMPDRIEAGTLLLAGAITGGSITVKKMVPHHIESLLIKLKESGFQIATDVDSVSIRSPKSWKAVDVTTQPYPLFPTDLQAQYMALMTVADGTSVITETVFENRFMHVQELCRLGADITPKTRVAVVRGKPHGLRGAPVMATDLRASASLVLAGLAAQGTTTINRIYHLHRGYEHLDQKLASLGASIRME